MKLYFWLMVGTGSAYWLLASALAELMLRIAAR